MVRRDGEWKSPSGFLALLRLQLRLVGPAAAVFAGLLLMVDLGGRLQPQLKSLKADDRGAIQLLLILLGPLFLSFVSIEREPFSLILSWPLKLGRVIFTKLLAVTALSFLLFGFGWILADLRVYFNQRLMGMPGVGGVLGGILYIAILGQVVCLAERSLLPRILALLGWTFLAYWISFLVVFPHVGDVGPVLSSLALSVVALVALLGADSLAVGRFQRWQVHGGALLLLSIMPGIYLFNLYGIRIPGPLDQEAGIPRSLLFPRLEFYDRLNPRSGAVERFGFFQPYRIRFFLTLLPEGWLLGRTWTSLGEPTKVFLMHVETREAIKLQPGSDLVRIGGGIWASRLERRGVDSAMLSLSPLRNLQDIHEIEIQGVHLDSGIMLPDIEQLNAHTLVARVSTGKDFGVLLFDLRKKRQVATFLGPSGGLLSYCSRFIPLRSPNGRTLYDVRSGDRIPFELEWSASIACNDKLLGIFHAESGVVRGIAIYPLADRISPDSRQWIEIEPSRLLGRVRGTPYLGSGQEIVPLFRPQDRPPLRLDRSLGQPEWLQAVPGTQLSLLGLSAGKTLLLDPTMSKYWILNSKLQPWVQQAFLSLDQGILALLQGDGDAVRCSLATGECNKSQSTDDLPITWIDID